MAPIINASQKIYFRLALVKSYVFAVAGSLGALLGNAVGFHLKGIHLMRSQNVPQCKQRGSKWKQHFALKNHCSYF